MADDERRCTICGTRLSIYNPDQRCGACTTAARLAPDRQVFVPPGMWLRADVRRALGRWDWATVLSAVLAQPSVTQGQVAEATGLSQAHVSRLAAGRGGCWDIRVVNRLVDGLGAPRLLAGLAPTTDHDAQEEVGTTDRRTVLAAMATTPFAAMLGSTSNQVTAGQARQVRALVPHLFGLDDRVGGDTVGQLAAWCTKQVDRLLTVRRRSG
jgi:hypothetical protein